MKPKFKPNHSTYYIAAVSLVAIVAVVVLFTHYKPSGGSAAQEMSGETASVEGSSSADSQVTGYAFWSNLLKKRFSKDKILGQITPPCTDPDNTDPTSTRDPGRADTRKKTVVKYLLLGVPKEAADYCIYDTLYEQYCENKTKKSVQYDCSRSVSLGYGSGQTPRNLRYGFCQDGACVTQCVDSDGGSRSDIYGEVFTIDANGNPVLRRDECKGNAVIEASCNGRLISSREIHCDGKCQNGECVPGDYCGMLPPYFRDPDQNYQGAQECRGRPRGSGYSCSFNTTMGKYEYVPASMNPQKTCYCDTRCALQVRAP